MSDDLDALADVVQRMTAGPWEDGIPHWSIIARDPEGRSFHIAQTAGPVNNEGIILLRNHAEQLIALARRTEAAESEILAPSGSLYRAVIAERDAALARCAEFETVALQLFTALFNDDGTGRSEECRKEQHEARCAYLVLARSVPVPQEPSE